ncbi:MAG: ATP-binding cassette domain-containing protein [Geminicoccaceae bacterium]|nr:MAG: ATP-binding cassette domain-containing protein [Geminicoccaceae bacterium]
MRNAGPRSGSLFGRLGHHLNFLAPVALFSLGGNLLLLGVPLYSMQIYDRVLPTQSVTTLVVLSLLIGAMLLASFLLDLIRGRLMVQLAAKVATGMSGDALKAGLRGDGTAAPVQASNDLDVVRRTLAGPVALAVFDAPWALLAILIIALIHPFLGVITAIGALLLVAACFAAAIWTRRAQEGLRRVDGRMAATLHDFGADNEALRAMGGIDAVESDLLARRGERVHLELRAGYANAFARAVSRGLRSTLLLAALGGAAWLAVQQAVAPGAIIAVSLLLVRALGPIEQLASGWFQLVEAGQAWRRLDALTGQRTNRPRTRLPAAEGHLAVTDVAFRYGQSGPLLLRGLTFEVGGGETLAIAGAVGAGKSTMCRLLAGAQPPIMGDIRLDGASLEDWPSDQWGRSIGYLPQEFQLFAGTVAENIARFAAVDDEAVVEAARLAGAHEPILQLPQAYDTDLGDPRLRLSSGERQMIGLARAFYRKPRYLLLDEPTFHLDDAAENRLVSALHELKAAGCTIVIASRSAALLQLADHLLILQRGRPATFRAHAAMAAVLRPRLAAETNAPADDQEQARTA